MNMSTAVLLVLAGYLAGSIPFGYWLVRLLRGEDVRRCGSGNIGGTNVWRCFGARYGLAVVLFDVLKGFVPALIASLTHGSLVAVLAGAAAMLGHWRPLFMRFRRGGKMVATCGGAAIGIAPFVAVVGMAVWALVSSSDAMRRSPRYWRRSPWLPRRSYWGRIFRWLSSWAQLRWPLSGYIAPTSGGSLVARSTVFSCGTGAEPSGGRKLALGNGAVLARAAHPPRSACGIGCLVFGGRRLGDWRLGLFAYRLACLDAQLLLGSELATLRDYERLHRHAHVFEDVNRHCVTADALEWIWKLDLSPIDADLAGAPDLVGDVAGGNRAEERTGGTGLHLEAEHRLAQPLGDRLGLPGAARLLQRSARVSLSYLLDFGPRRRLGQLARDQEVARVAACHRDHVAPQPQLLHVLKKDDFHSCSLLRYVGEKGHLARALDRNRELPLVTAADSSDAPGPDLAALGHVAAQAARVLPVDLLDFVLTEMATFASGRHRAGAHALALLVLLSQGLSF